MRRCFQATHGSQAVGNGTESVETPGIGGEWSLEALAWQLFSCYRSCFHNSGGRQEEVSQVIRCHGHLETILKLLKHALAELLGDFPTPAHHTRLAREHSEKCWATGI